MMGTLPSSDVSYRICRSGNSCVSLLGLSEGVAESPLE